MHHKKAKLAAAISVIFVSAIAHTQETNKEYIYKPNTGSFINIQQAVASWSVQSSLLSDWTSQGAAFNCSEWTPPASLVNIDEMFTQTRQCDQLQSRQRIDTLYSFQLDSTRQSDPVTETITTRVEQSRAVSGLRDYIVSSGFDAWSAWEPLGGLFNCSEYLPLAAEMPQATFTQTSTCQQSSRRQREAFNLYASGTKQYTGVEVQEDDINIARTQQATGEQEEWNLHTYVYGTWENAGEAVETMEWAPALNRHKTDLNQYMSVNQPQQRTVQPIYRNINTGRLVEAGEVTLEERVNPVNIYRTIEVQLTDFAFNRIIQDTAWAMLPKPVYGAFEETYLQSKRIAVEHTKDATYLVDGEVIGSAEDVDSFAFWEDVERTLYVSMGDPYFYRSLGCPGVEGTWAPTITEADTGTVTQTRLCNEENHATYQYVDEAGGIIQEGISIANATGVLKERIATITDSGYDINNAGSRILSCAEYSPAIDQQVEDFQQARTCLSRLANNRSITYNDGSAGNYYTYYREENYSETKDVEVHIGDWTWRYFTNPTRRYDLAWSPDLASVMEEFKTTGDQTPFTQTSDRLERQYRSIDYYIAGSRQLYNRWEEERVFNQGPQERELFIGMFGYRNYSSAPTDCGEYSRILNYGSYITQGKECTVYYEARYGFAYTNSNTSIANDEQINYYKPLSRPQEVFRRGSKVDSAPRVVDGSTTCGDWSPGIGEQTDNFTQTRSCSRQLAVYREYIIDEGEEGAGEVIYSELLGTPTTDNYTENRDVIVQIGDISDATGQSVNCTEWDHERLTRNDATRTCGAPYYQEVQYSINGEVVSTKLVLQYNNTLETATATATDRINDSGWVNVLQPRDCYKLENGETSCEVYRERTETTETLYTNGIYFDTAESVATDTSRQNFGFTRPSEECRFFANDGQTGMKVTRVVASSSQVSLNYSVSWANDVVASGTGGLSQQNYIGGFNNDYAYYIGKFSNAEFKNTVRDGNAVDYTETEQWGICRDSVAMRQ